MAGYLLAMAGYLLVMASNLIGIGRDEDHCWIRLGHGRSVLNISRLSRHPLHPLN